jgi:outer membrane protein TolC
MCAALISAMRISASNGRRTALGTSYRNNTSLNGTVSAVSLQWLLFDFGQRAAENRYKHGVGKVTEVAQARQAYAVSC